MPNARSNSFSDEGHVPKKPMSVQASMGPDPLSRSTPLHNSMTPPQSAESAALAMKSTSPLQSSSILPKPAPAFGERRTRAATVNSRPIPPPLRTGSNASEVSPLSRLVSGRDSPKSPREQLEDFLEAEDPQPSAKVKRARNASAPLPRAARPTPLSPRQLSSPLHGAASPPGKMAIRTSSIDSAISSPVSHSHKDSADSMSSTSSDVSTMIRVAGSPEALAQHLLREKQQLESRNTQLWTLVEKQRKLLLGLNQDLERASRDKERYRKQVKDLSGPRDITPPAPLATSVKNALRSQTASPREEILTPRPLQIDPDRTAMEDKPKNLASRHKHRNTSSSDIGILDIPHSSDFLSLPQIPPGASSASSSSSSLNALRTKPDEPKGDQTLGHESVNPATILPSDQTIDNAPPSKDDLHGSDASTHEETAGVRHTEDSSETPQISQNTSLPDNSPRPRSPEETSTSQMVGTPPRASHNLTDPSSHNTPPTQYIETLDHGTPSPHKIAVTAESLPATPKPPGIFRGFVSEAYPDLLLPPTALPSIKVMVVSSRLKPSRQSVALKSMDDEPVFTLGVSGRYDSRDLWQVEKAIVSLQHLDQQLRSYDIKLPDRSLFSGHAPSRVDARKAGLERYFEALLQAPLDERSAIVLCRYLSTSIVEPGTLPSSPMAIAMPAPGAQTKEGFLTKRGKNFGGWKSRYFVLDAPVLKYFELPGGTLLGKINLYRAQIGRQSTPRASTSAEEGDSQYRHAFLIREPKRKDATTFVDHVLCAENDGERDEWVDALMSYINGQRPPVEKKASASRSPLLRQTSSDSYLRALPYEDVRAADPPQRLEASPSPSRADAPLQSMHISGPQNGTKISDAVAWGNKPASGLSPQSVPLKKRGLFGFHNNNLAPQPVSATHQQYQEQLSHQRPAFGAQLADAVEFSPPRGVGDVCLPAVVYRCLQYLEVKQAAGEEGIFRMSGSNTLIKNLRSKFNAEGDLDLLAGNQWYDVHAVASLLKQYLRDLPANILTKELLLQFLAVLEFPDKSQQPTAYNVLVHQLPAPNFHLLRALCRYLIVVVNNSEVNKMDMRNIGIVFSPTLNIPTPVMLGFLTGFETIFGPKTGSSFIPTVKSDSSSSPLSPSMQQEHAATGLGLGLVTGSSPDSGISSRKESAAHDDELFGPALPARSSDDLQRQTNELSTKNEVLERKNARRESSMLAMPQSDRSTRALASLREA